MILMPIVYVRDMAASVDFYERLGFTVDVRSRSDGWVELRAGDGAVLALHVADAPDVGQIELSMVAEEPLERIGTQAAVSRGIADEAFGRSIVLEDPNGMQIQVNEHDRELYS